MSYRVKFLTEAEHDMDLIEEYLSQFYPGTSPKFFAKLKEKVLALEEQPFIYPIYDDDPYFRQMTVEKYLLFYHVDEKRNLVTVHRIIHSARDISRQILE